MRYSFSSDAYWSTAYSDVHVRVGACRWLTGAARFCSKHWPLTINSSSPMKEEEIYICICHLLTFCTLRLKSFLHSCSIKLRQFHLVCSSLLFTSHQQKLNTRFFTHNSIKTSLNVSLIFIQNNRNLLITHGPQI